MLSPISNLCLLFCFKQTIFPPPILSLMKVLLLSIILRHHHQAHQNSSYPQYNNNKLFLEFMHHHHTSISELPFPIFTTFTITTSTLHTNLPLIKKITKKYLFLMNFVPRSWKRQRGKKVGILL